MKARVKKDIPLRIHGGGTWVEAGEYEILRRFDHSPRYLIVLKELKKERLLTIVRAEEVDIV